MKRMLQKKKPSSQHILLLTTLCLGGCETMGPAFNSKLPLEENKAMPSQKEDADGLVYRELDNKPEDDDERYRVEAYPGSGDFISPPVAGQPAALSGSSPARGRYTLNFDDADLGEVAKVILGDTLNQNYVLDPKVAGRVTLQTSQPLTQEELLPTMEMLLRMNGAVLVKEAGGYMIEPEVNALQASSTTGISVAGGRQVPPGFQMRVFPLRYVGVKEMRKVLEPIMPPKAIVYSDPVRNLMMIAGTARELNNVTETISVFDVDVLRGQSVGMFPLKNVDAETMVKELDVLTGESGETPLSGMFKLVAMERLNAVMVITPQPRYLDRIGLWIDRLDKANNSTSGGGVNVYRVQNMDALDLADTLNEIFTGASSSRSSTSSPQLAPGMQGSEVSSRNNNQRRSTSNNRNNRGGDVANVGDDVRIIADEVNNSIVTIATAQEYEAIMEVIRQLDVPPLQVLVDATIVEVALVDNLSFGMQWFFNSGSSNTQWLTSSLSDGIVQSEVPGFSYSMVNSAADVQVVLNSLSEDSKVNVVSSPSLMVLNNQEATIEVGDEVPIRATESTNTSGGENPIQTSSIEMRDTGVSLKVKPRVNAGGMVLMEIEQQVDDAVRTSTSDIDSPTIQQRQIQTTVAVKSGETIVLGGLIADRRERSKSGVPLLSKIPVIGSLFGATDKASNRTELVVLITPRVAKDSADVREITYEFKRKLSGIYEEMHTDQTRGISGQPFADDDKQGVTPEQVLEQPLQPAEDMQPQEASSGG